MKSVEPICTFAPGSISYRGIPVDEVASHLSFVEALILLITGSAPFPLDPRVNLISAILNACLDHGDKPPTTQNVRNCASVGVPYTAAAASALVACGVDHFPVEGAAALFARLVACEGEVTSLQSILRSYRVFPGFGHPVHTVDPRVSVVVDLAGILGLAGKHVAAMHFVETYLAPKNVHPNIGGLAAALWLDMGFSVETASLLPTLGRMVGWAAHYEEARRGPKFAGTPPKENP